VRATCVDFLSFDEMVAHVDRARVVVTHAGVGSILLALSRFRRPVVVPRLRRFGEAVDDHQVPLGRRLDEQGLVTFVEDPTAGLEAAVAAVAGTTTITIGSARLAEDLRHELRTLIGARP
jgi:UDP-N-acetylglucosamine transferase subunit ALG13